ncbi:MAG: hypothetical protein A3E87_02055 [Gammaproteobacteria bacterium RIFCSPHIGHO2_12_FULL_35_23]|nr:MAG: hypothetical protein A3E87_02055 [Gammaproteobacteria bacterium RIFCSPHIGHO2_12_FULL_35_23]
MFLILTAYLPLTTWLIISVFFAPAVAIFPRLLSTPLLASTIPIISILICNLFAALLLTFNLYDHTPILIINLLFIALAFFQLTKSKNTLFITWQSADFSLIIMNIGLLLPLVIFSGLSAFSIDDALASWNFWALNFYNQQLAPELYPPFFSLIISYCYKLLNSFLPQGAVKAALCPILAFSLLNATAFSCKTIKNHLLSYLIIIAISVFPGLMFFSGYKFYSIGYADPLMAAALGCAVALYINYYQNKKLFVLFIMTLCTITACWSKQPALLFAGLSLPIIGLIQLFQRQLQKKELLLFIIIAIGAYSWAFGPGAGFYHNSGVIYSSLNASLSFKAIILTFFNSVYRYFLCKPLVLVLFILAALSAWQFKPAKYLFIGFVIPSTLLWFIFGRYDIREGLHITAICGIFVASTNFLFNFHRYLPSWYQQAEKYLAVWHRRLAVILLILGLLIACLFSVLTVTRSHNTIFPLNSNKTNAYKYFPSIGGFVYSIMQNSKLVILGPTHYEAGLFYGHTIFIQTFPNDSTALKNIILQNKINYIVVSSKIDPDATIAMQRLQKQAPNLLQEILISKPHIHYQIFCVKKFTVCSYQGA